MTGNSTKRYPLWVDDVDPLVTIKYSRLRGSAGIGNRQGIYFTAENNNVDIAWSAIIDRNGNGGMLAAGVTPTFSGHHNIYDAAYPGTFTNDIASPNDTTDPQGDF